MAYDGFSEGGESEYIGMVVATEELSRASLGAGGSLITRPEILTRALLAGGTEAQKQSWLPKLASAEVMAAVAVTEPDYGSDVAGVKCQATPTEGGWLINGVKTWCTFGARADVLMLLARTNPDKSLTHKGLSMFVVPKPRGRGPRLRLHPGRPGADGGAPGGGKMEGRAIDTIGYRGMHSYEIAFDDWFVAAENQVGGEDGLGRGFYYQMAGFENGRLQTAARAVGRDAGRLRGRPRQYADDRVVFGQPIADYQLTQAKLGRMVVLIQAARQFAYVVAGLMARGERPARGLDGEGLRLQGRRVGHPRGHADPRRLRLRRGVHGEPVLRRRPGAVHLRGRRRDPLPQGHRPPHARRARRSGAGRAAAPPAAAGLSPAQRPAMASARARVRRAVSTCRFSIMRPSTVTTPRPRPRPPRRRR